tara:strand:- start:11622 stop:12575 length:954 start_codon:yes stop_codon:yes gene_type:complete
MAKYISFGESLVVDSGVQTNVAPATGTADADFIVTGTQTAVTGTTITVTGGTFQTSGILANDIVADITNSALIGTVLSISDNDNLQITGGTMPNAANFSIYRPNVLFDAAGNFTSLGVAIGDTVTNTVTTSTATVTALNSNNPSVPFVGQALTLSADIFGAAYADLEDEYTISAPADQLFDNGQNFLTTVAAKDEVINTTDSTSARVIEVVNDNRLKLSGSIMATGEAFSIYSDTRALQRFVPISGIMFVNSKTDLTTELFMSGDWKITLTHDAVTQINSPMVAAFQNAMLKAASGATGAVRVELPPTIYITGVEVA